MRNADVKGSTIRAIALELFADYGAHAPYIEIIDAVAAEAYPNDDYIDVEDEINLTAQRVDRVLQTIQP